MFYTSVFFATFDVKRRIHHISGMIGTAAFSVDFIKTIIHDIDDAAEAWILVVGKKLKLLKEHFGFKGNSFVMFTEFHFGCGEAEKGD